MIEFQFLTTVVKSHFRIVRVTGSERHACCACCTDLKGGRIMSFHLLEKLFDEVNSLEGS